MKDEPKRTLVLGLARSGMGAVDLLLRLGAPPVGYDRREPAAEWRDRIRLWEEEGARFHFGEPALSLLDGADRVVASPGLPPDHPLLAEARRRGMEILAEIELAYRVMEGRLTAVTGTNGKSTTTTLIGEILKQDGRRTAVAGNIGRPLSDAVGPFRDFDEIVAEVSSFQLETVDRFRPRVAVLLNVTEDHLDRHGSLDEYLRLKGRVFENQREGDWAVLNYDDPACRRLAPKTGARTAWISRTAEGGFPGLFLRYGEILSTLEGEEELVGLERDIAVPGPHNRTNALAAAAAAKILGVPNNVIRETLREFPGLEHRLEKAGTVRGISFINDSKATNVESVAYALQSFDAPIVWIAGGRPKKPNYESLSDLTAIHVRALVLIGEAAPLVEAALPHLKNRSYADSMEKAVRIAYRVARKGDVVLLSPGGTSFDWYRDFEERGRDFKKEVRALAEREKHDEE